MTKAVTVKNKGGRPKANVDPVLVYELATLHCTKQEIARIVGCSIETLYARFSEVMQDGEAVGKRSLRRLQWQQAEKGNVHMLIWLGKQLLNQKDRSPEEVANTIINVQVLEMP